MTETKTHHDHKHEIHIHIDRIKYHSPNPTTNAALYELGKVPEGHQIYREAHGDHEDVPVFNDGEQIHLKEDEHFYSQDKPFKGFEIFVNTHKKIVQKNGLTFDEVVRLAYDNPPTGPNIVISIDFRKAAGKRREGTLHPGGTVSIKNGTIFDVTATDKS